MKPGKTDCRILTKYADDIEMSRSWDESKNCFWMFARGWIGRFSNSSLPKVMERFIFLWVTVNHWASISVFDGERSDQDNYLIHSMAKDEKMRNRFSRMYNEEPSFREKADELVSMAPIFSSWWLRQNNIRPVPKDQRQMFIEKALENEPWRIVNGTPRIYFEPKCALYHRARREAIPVDWEHVIHIIYQIRCNLFHGGKDYYNIQDWRLVELAYSILWSIWAEEIPAEMSANLFRTRTVGGNNPEDHII